MNTFIKKILFIEDEPVLQQSMGSALQNAGFEVLSALDGEIGLRLAQSEIPDLILLDLILPKKDGFEVLKELKADKKTASIPVLVLTNLEGTADIERVLSAGATTFLVKANYRLEELVKKVKEALKI